jgi:nucleotide-binding universal stress UspA family protein
MSDARAEPLVVGVGVRSSGMLLNSAAWLGLHLQQPVHVVSVLPLSPLSGWEGAHATTGTQAEEEYATSRRSMIDCALGRVAVGAPEWSVHIVRGDAARMITGEARRCGAALIVMGLGRHQPIDRLLASETTLATVRLADCPVLALAEEMCAPAKRVLVATDFSATCANAVQHALPLLSPQAELVFAHVWNPSQREAQLARDEDYRMDLPARFAHFIDALRLPDSMSVTHRVLEGNTTERLVNLADELRAELVVAGRHGRGAWERLVVGSVATRLLRGGTRSIFIVPESVVAPPHVALPLDSTSYLSSEREKWPALLSGFTAHNKCRQTLLRVSDETTRATCEDRGYQLECVSCGMGDAVVEIALGEPNGQRHVRRVLRDVSGLTLDMDSDGRHRSLRITHGTGETVIGFLPEQTRMEVAR